MTLQEYIGNVSRRYKLGNATEHTFRGDLQQLLETIVPDISATNEPKRQACGAPDFTSVFLEKGNGLEGLAGCRKYLGNNQFEDAIGLLDGIIGIGLFLLDVIMERDDQIDWQSCFLLNPQNTNFSNSQ